MLTLLRYFLLISLCCIGCALCCCAEALRSLVLRFFAPPSTDNSAGGVWFYMTLFPAAFGFLLLGILYGSLRLLVG